MAIKGLLRVIGIRNIDELVDVAYNGEESVDFIKKAIEENNPDRYCLILTDCSMPHMDGYESSKIIRSLLPRHLYDIKIHAITGHVEQEYVQKAMDHGMDAVHSKPLKT